MTHGKRYKALVKEVPQDLISIEEALKFIKDKSDEKFDPTVELHVRLGVDPKQSDQQVRGSVALPAGTGKDVRVVAVVDDAKVKEAESAGADRTGGEDIVKEIKAGKMDFDVLVATPDMMPKLGSVAKVLGPRGLMPNPKTETVGPDVGKLIAAIKAGKANFKTDDYGIIHMPVGKKSFDLEKLQKNIEAALDAIKAAKPKGIKGQYIKNVRLASSMGPGLKVKVTG